MRTVLIDCAGVATPGEFWKRYIDAVAPEGAAQFGRNLDAFWDAIEHGGPGDPGDVKLVFTTSAALGRLQTASGGSFLEALRSIARDATQTAIEFA